MKRSCNSYPILWVDERREGRGGKKEGKKYIFAASVIGKVSLPSLGNETMELVPCSFFFFLLLFPPPTCYSRNDRYWLQVLRFPSSWWHVFFNMFVTNARFRMERRRWIATLEAILRESERDVRFMIRDRLQGFFEKFFFVWEGGERGEANIQIVEDFRNRNHYHFMLMKFRGKVFGIDPRVRISSEGRKEGRKEREIYFCPFNWTYRQAPMQISPKLDEKVMKSQIICGTTWKFG